MVRYITFIRNNRTGEEFISTAKAWPGAHQHVVAQQMKKYPKPTYTVHTAYTENELEEMLETLRRWTGGEKKSNTAPQHLHALTFAG